MQMFNHNFHCKVFSFCVVFCLVFSSFLQLKYNTKICLYSLELVIGVDEPNSTETVRTHHLKRRERDNSMVIFISEFTHSAYSGSALWDSSPLLDQILASRQQEINNDPLWLLVPGYGFCYN